MRTLLDLGREGDGGLVASGDNPTEALWRCWRTALTPGSNNPGWASVPEDLMIANILGFLEISSPAHRREALIVIFFIPRILWLAR
jgi:hypothetical protein